MLYAFLCAIRHTFTGVYLTLGNQNKIALSFTMPLIDQILARLLDHDKQPLSRAKATRMCEIDICFYGKDAKTDCYMRGTKGQGIRKTRRLFPNGPVGEILWEVDGKFLYIEFKSKDILLFSDEIYRLDKAFHSFIVNKTEFGDICKTGLIDLEYMPKLKQYICDIDIDDNVLTLLHKEAKGHLYMIISGMLRIDSIAKSRRWLSVSENNWANKSFFLSDKQSNILFTCNNKKITDL